MRHDEPDMSDVLVDLWSDLSALRGRSATTLANHLCSEHPDIVTADAPWHENLNAIMKHLALGESTPGEADVAAFASALGVTSDTLRRGATSVRRVQRGAKSMVRFTVARRQLAEAQRMVDEAMDERESSLAALTQVELSEAAQLANFQMNGGGTE